MESKQMTLRSQTVQCPHCGEYYSVTYKYCPFCDAGHKAEAKKKASRKQHAASLFTGLFSSSEEDAGMDVPVQETGFESAPRQRRERRTEKEFTYEGENRSSRRDGASGESRRRSRPSQVSTPIPRSAGFRKKKTSEMTEEEKKAYRAEREARAAARKRERDRAARASALVDVSGPAEGTLAGAESPAPAAPVHVPSPSGMETVEFTFDPMQAAPAGLEFEAAPAGETAEEQPAQGLTLEETGPQMDAAPQEFFLEETAGQMDAAPAELTGDPAPMAPQDVEVEVPMPEAVPPVKPRTITPETILQGDSELDALLSEIRGLIDEAPAPVPPKAEINAEEAPARSAAEAGTAVPEGKAPGKEAAPVVLEKPAPAAAVPSEPAAVQEIPEPAEPAAEAVQEAPRAEAPVTEAVQEAPGTEEPAAEAVQEIPQAAAAQDTPNTAEAPQAAPETAAPVSEFDMDDGDGWEPIAEVVVSDAVTEAPEDPAVIWSPETTAAVEAAAMRKTEPARQRNRQRSSRNRRSSLPLIPILAAVVVVILAIVVVTKVVLPATQTPKEAESLFLDRAEVTFTSTDETVTLSPIFVPEGSTAEIQWTCSNWSVVDVDPNGLLTPKAPGEAMVTATLPNGAYTSTMVTCVWGELPAEGGAVPEEGTESAAAAAPEPAGLSATEITFDGEGKTQQLVLNNVTGAVKWTSSKPGVATVSADGTVTAVSKGGATITAESNGSKYNCNVRCIW